MFRECPRAASAKYNAGMRTHWITAAILLAIVSCRPGGDTKEVGGQLAQMDRSSDQIRSNHAKLVALSDQYRVDIANLKGKVEASANQPDAARVFANQLALTQDALAHNEQSESKVAHALERALEIRTNFARDHR